MPNIKMYGTPTCKDCIVAKQVFKELGTSYEFININNDPEATKTALRLQGLVVADTDHSDHQQLGIHRPLRCRHRLVGSELCDCARG